MSEHTLKVRGLLWHGTRPDDMRYSVEIDGQFCDVLMPEVTAAIRKEAVRRGKSMGQMADLINNWITHEEEKERIRLGIPMFSVTTELTREQMADFGAVFGFMLPPPIDVDGDSE